MVDDHIMTRFNGNKCNT